MNFFTLLLRMLDTLFGLYMEDLWLFRNPFPRNHTSRIDSIFLCNERMYIHCELDRLVDILQQMQYIFWLSNVPCNYNPFLTNSENKWKKYSIAENKSDFPHYAISISIEEYVI